MLDLLWLVPALPFAGFAILLCCPLPKAGVAGVGVGSVGLSALIAVAVAVDFSSMPAGEVYTQSLWTWLNVAGFAPRLSLYLDGLALVMILMITGVGLLTHWYAAEFMAGEPGYRRFFAAMNLFVAAMLVLVLADDLLFLYLGWEGVGLCNYLLIGFWYRNPANGRAARKAFIVTRIGDVALAIGLLLLFTQLGTLNIQELPSRAEQAWPVGSPLAVAAALLLLGGAVGKSAQVPLQTWLPDAMAGPTPVSALIHGATMVTAGVYLLARTEALFALAPTVQTTVAALGVLTLLLAGFSALTQTDIKRILAYSTISQVAYMFLAVGAGAGAAAIFHLLTHAFFKALLFLAAGVLIMRLHGEHNIYRMGGLRKTLPVAFWSFLIGSAALAALPLVTAGFYSKDQILLAVWTADQPWLWLLALLGALLTAIYAFRPVFVIFFGTKRADLEIAPRAGWRMIIPLAVLAVLSIGGGLFAWPLERLLPAGEHPEGGILPQLLAAVVPLVGIYLAWYFFQQRPEAITGKGLWGYWRAGWGFDWLYNSLFVRPFCRLARINRNDVIDDVYQGIAWFSRLCHEWLSVTQSGRLRWYAASLAGGAVLITAMVMLA